MWIIAGRFRRHSLQSPKGEQTRPTSSRLRESLFNICQQKIEGAHFLDLFAGSGAMGFEALSRGASSATFIDSHRNAIQCIKSNAAQLHVESFCQILHGDIFQVLNRLEQGNKTFDLIYADPPYCTRSKKNSENFYSTQLIQWVDSHHLLKPHGLLFVEEDFHHQPQLAGLQNLRLQDSRRMGVAALQQYQKNSCAEDV